MRIRTARLSLRTGFLTTKLCFYDVYVGKNKTQKNAGANLQDDKLSMRAIRVGGNMVLKSTHPTECRAIE